MNNKKLLNERILALAGIKTPQIMGLSTNAHTLNEYNLNLNEIDINFDDILQEGFIDGLKKYITMPLVALMFASGVQGISAQENVDDFNPDEVIQMVEKLKSPESKLYASAAIAIALQKFNVKNVNDLDLKTQIQVYNTAENIIDKKLKDFENNIKNTTNKATDNQYDVIDILQSAKGDLHIMAYRTEKEIEIENLSAGVKSLENSYNQLKSIGKDLKESINDSKNYTKQLLNERMLELAGIKTPQIMGLSANAPTLNETDGTDETEAQKAYNAGKRAYNTTGENRGSDQWGPYDSHYQRGWNDAQQEKKSGLNENDVESLRNDIYDEIDNGIPMGQDNLETMIGQYEDMGGDASEFQGHLGKLNENDYEGQDSECCGAAIHMGDICSKCGEHTEPYDETIDDPMGYLGTAQPNPPMSQWKGLGEDHVGKGENLQEIPQTTKFEDKPAPGVYVMNMNTGNQVEVYMGKNGIEKVELIDADYMDVDSEQVKSYFEKGYPLNRAVAASMSEPEGVSGEDLMGLGALNEATIRETIGLTKHITRHKPHGKNLINERFLGIVGLKPIGGLVGSPKANSFKPKLKEVKSDLSRAELYQSLPMLHSNSLIGLAEELNIPTGQKWDVILEDITKAYFAGGHARELINNTLKMSGLI